jgi:hypothetical protein
MTKEKEEEEKEEREDEGEKRVQDRKYVKGELSEDKLRGENIVRGLSEGSFDFTYLPRTLL